MMHDFMITHDGKMNARVYYLDGKHVTEKTYKRVERECKSFDTFHDFRIRGGRMASCKCGRC